MIVMCLIVDLLFSTLVASSFSYKIETGHQNCAVSSVHGVKAETL